MPRTVYVLTAHWQDGTTGIVGVYATKAMATSAKRATRKEWRKGRASGWLDSQVSFAIGSTVFHAKKRRA